MILIYRHNKQQPNYNTAKSVWDFFEKLTAKAKSSRQRIVLPEGTEPRTLTAAARIIAEGIADVILIGDPAEINAKANELKLTNIEKATLIDPQR